MSDKVDFLHTDKHETFLAVDFNTFPIKVSYKVILSILIYMVKHYQSPWNNKFAITSFLGWSSLLAWREASKFLQAGIIIFDGSGNTCPKYPT